MAKRSRRDRRQGQLSRAVLARDRPALQAFAATNPALVARALAKVFSDPGADAAHVAAMQETVEDLAASMRRSGQHEAACHLAASVARPSSRLRLEHALAAFACGDDAQAAEVAAPDARVKAILDVLLDAARGSPPRTFSAGAPPLLHALRAVAEAVSWAARGQPEKAKAAVRHLSADHRDAMLVRETRAAVELSCGTATAALAALQSLFEAPALRSFAGARMAAVLEATALHPDLATAPCVCKALSESQHQAVLQQVAEARFGASIPNDSGAVAHDSDAVQMLAPPSEAVIRAWFEFLNVAGAKAVAEASLGTAYIYEGFACIDRDPQRAEQAFDRAIEHGADRVEALRGKLILARVGQPCVECGAPHVEPDEVAIAAEDLAANLHWVPRASRLARVAWLLAAEAWVATGDKQAALAAIRAARPAEGPSMQEALDSLETKAADCDRSYGMSLPG